MSLYVNLHGGSSYAHDNIAVRYDSLAEAAADWDDFRRSNGHRRVLDRASGEYVYAPCWGDMAGWSWAEGRREHAGFAWYVDDDDPGLSVNEHGITVFDTTDQYPDRELTVGPRGGLRWERC